MYKLAWAIAIGVLSIHNDASAAFFQGLGCLDGGSMCYSIASDVSGDGRSVVGTSLSLADGMQDIRELLLANGVTAVADWQLQFATAVSADGRTIVGSGRGPSGQGGAWIAILPVPEPVLAPILWLASLALFTRARSRT